MTSWVSGKNKTDSNVKVKRSNIKQKNKLAWLGLGVDKVIFRVVTRLLEGQRKVK